MPGWSTAPYQADGRFATLEQQALGALLGHAQIKTLPAPSLLGDVAAYEKTQFSSPDAERLSDALAAGQPPTAPTGTLSPLEQEGAALFGIHCATCHGGPRGNQPIPPLAGLQDIMVSKPLPPFAADLPFPPAPPLRVRLWAIRPAGGGPLFVRPSTDPGKALISGRIEDFAQFKVPVLFGVAKTAPYFHDNSAPDLETVMHHYQQLFIAVRRIIPPTVPFPIRPNLLEDSQIAPLVAYVKTL